MRNGLKETDWKNGRTREKAAWEKELMQGDDAIIKAIDQNRLCNELRAHSNKFANATKKISLGNRQVKHKK